MFDFNTLKNNSQLAGKAKVNSLPTYDSEYKEAMSLLENFSETHDEKQLKKASLKLANCIKLKRTEVEPYFYLSYIFYLFNNNRLAKEYLALAEMTDPGFHLLPELKTIIG